MFSFFQLSSRGFVLGLWSACASVGNILGAVMAANVLNYGYEVIHPTLKLLYICKGRDVVMIRNES